MHEMEKIESFFYLDLMGCVGDDYTGNGGGGVGGGDGLLGTQREFKRQLAGDLSAVYRFLPDDEHGGGAGLHHGGDHDIHGGVFCLCSSKTLINQENEDDQILLHAVSNISLIWIFICDFIYILWWCCESFLIVLFEIVKACHLYTCMY